jgi:hypothetical protein
MNKGLQAFSLIALFAVSGFIGYIAEGILIEKQLPFGIAKPAPVVEPVVEPIPEPVVEPVVTLSTIPTFVEGGGSAPKRDSAGKYNFAVQAVVESGDALKYILYKDEACTEEVASSDDGNFKNIPSIANATYFLRVQNTATGEYSEIAEVKGFVWVKMYTKVSKSELEGLINSGDFGRCPSDYKERILRTIKIEVRGMNPNERGVSSLADMFSKISMGTWASVNVVETAYDAQGRLSKLVVSVNY